MLNPFLERFEEAKRKEEQENAVEAFNSFFENLNDNERNAVLKRIMTFNFVTEGYHGHSMSVVPNKKPCKECGRPY